MSLALDLVELQSEPEPMCFLLRIIRPPLYLFQPSLSSPEIETEKDEYEEKLPRLRMKIIPQANNHCTSVSGPWR